MKILLTTTAATGGSTMALLMIITTQLQFWSDPQDPTIQLTVVISTSISQRPTMILKAIAILHLIVTIRTLITSSAPTTPTTTVAIVQIPKDLTTFILIKIASITQSITTVLVMILHLISTLIVHQATLTMEKNIALT